MAAYFHDLNEDVENAEMRGNECQRGYCSCIMIEISTERPFWQASLSGSMFIISGRLLGPISVIERKSTEMQVWLDPGTPRTPAGFSSSL